MKNRLFIDEDEFFGIGDEKKSKKRKRDAISTISTGRRRKEKDLRGVGTYKPKMKLLSMELVGADGLYYTIKKKVKMVDPLLPSYVRIPSQVPLPRSWARTVTPYTGLNHQFKIEGCEYIETEMARFDAKTLNRKFQAVLIDPPWCDMENDLVHHRHQVNAEQLYQLRIDEVVDAGLLFIWTEKHHIASCIQVASKWGFTYVENLIWVKQNVNHTISDVLGAQTFFASSKISLLIFKKGSGFAIKHQRNPDIIFDYIRHENKYLTLDKPKYAYTIAETLLPEACYNENTGQGLFLELWARRGARRKGWTQVAQQIPETPHFLSYGPESIPLP